MRLRPAFEGWNVILLTAKKAPEYILKGLNCFVESI